MARYVSWNEFVHQMLAHGEVEELIVRPDLDIVTIILHEGAVIKGKKVILKHILIAILSKASSIYMLIHLITSLSFQAHCRCGEQRKHRL